MNTKKEKRNIKKFKISKERDENNDKDDCKRFMIKENRKKQKYALKKKQKSGCSIKTNSRVKKMKIEKNDNLQKINHI